MEEYKELAARKSDLERTELQKEKTGVFTGSYARNPANREAIPIWVADYVLGRYVCNFPNFLGPLFLQLLGNVSDSLPVLTKSLELNVRCISQLNCQLDRTLWQIFFIKSIQIHAAMGLEQ